jgi:hypothetical protein
MSRSASYDEDDSMSNDGGHSCKAIFEQNGNIKQILFAMALGILVEERQIIRSQSQVFSKEPYASSSCKKQFIPLKKDLHNEITFCVLVADTDIEKSPRFRNWSVPRLEAYLSEHLIRDQKDIEYITSEVTLFKAALEASNVERGHRHCHQISTSLLQGSQAFLTCVSVAM